MVYSINRISPVRAANIVGLLYGVLGLATTAIMLPIFSFVPVPEPTAQNPNPAQAMEQMQWLLSLYPVLFLVMGWLVGLLGSLAYNGICRLTGGLKLTLERSATA